MNKTKKDLYQENKKLKDVIDTYNDFWEIDAIKECSKQLKFAKKSIYTISAVLLIISAFLLGLAW